MTHVTTPRGARRRRRGMSSIMAMMFLVLFGTLAVGFYGATTMSVQVAKNDRDAAVAQITAESGMKFVRRPLAQISVPPTTASNNVAAEVYADLTSSAATTT